MMMEHELALQLVELHMLSIQFGGDVRLPVFGNLRKLLGDIDLIHSTSKVTALQRSRFLGNRLGRKEVLRDLCVKAFDLALLNNRRPSNYVGTAAHGCPPSEARPPLLRTFQRNKSRQLSLAALN
jgi:hypothetical protein